MTRSEKQRLAGIGILSFIIVLLETIASGFHIGPFNITLSLIPIIIGAVLYGPIAGAALGAVFGTYVTASVIAGLDAGGALMLEHSAIATVFLCLLKSTAAGFLCGLAAVRLSKKSLVLAVIAAAFITPVVNTGIFTLGILLFFHPLVASWAGNISMSAYVLTNLIGLNFFIELLATVVLVPVILQIILAVRRIR